MSEHALARKIGLPLLTFYGLGTILGAGIYVLVGKVAAISGMLAPLSFVLSALIAWATAASYCRLVVLFPQSAGEALYVDKAFGWRWLTIIVGLLIVLVGAVSSATLANGFIGYMNVFIPVDRTSGIILSLLLLGMLAIWGIAEALSVAAFLTLLEIGGLLIVIFYCGDVLVDVPDRIGDLFVADSLVEWNGVLAGAFLAFYAFIGFEDMVNVVEEVRNPAIVMPRAIMLALGITTVLYILVALVAILNLPLAQLSASDAPLALVLEARYPDASRLIAGISVFAILNGVLIQMVMASRVLYGMADKHYLPGLLARVNRTTRTPVPATLVVVALVLGFALCLPLVALAKLTSFVVLIIFSLVNLALWRISRVPDYAGRIPRSHLPLLAAVICMGLLFSSLLHY